MKHLKTFENHLPNHVKQIDLYNINFKDISDFFESLNSKGYNVIRYNTSIKDIFIHKNYLFLSIYVKNHFKVFT